MRREPFVFNKKSGRLFIKANLCGILPKWVVAEVGFTKFKGVKGAFVEVIRAIKWHRQERDWAIANGKKDYAARESELVELLASCSIQVLPEEARPGFMEALR